MEGVAAHHVFGRLLFMGLGPMLRAEKSDFSLWDEVRSWNGVYLLLSLIVGEVPLDHSHHGIGNSCAAKSFHDARCWRQWTDEVLHLVGNACRASIVDADNFAICVEGF